jgi:hypothetical protein
MMKRLTWTFDRLRAMNIKEMLYRAKQSVSMHFQMGIRTGKPAEEQFGTIGRAWVEKMPCGFNIEPYKESADEILAGRYDIFAIKGIGLGFPPDWNRDPNTRNKAPLSHGLSLNYRDRQVVGDIKYLWELNRHSHLVKLAQAWHLTGRIEYARGCRQLLEAWFDQCPYGAGVNWSSSLELGVRLVNWAVAWQLLSVPPCCKSNALVPPTPREDILLGASAMPFRRRWLESIYLHCRFISKNLSQYSSANNHLLGELTGLFIAATVWPMWRKARDWRATAARQLEEEVLKQIGPDGVGREQAIWYQHEVIDMILLAGLFGQQNDIKFSQAFWERFERTVEFIAAVMDRRGNVPMIGDADGGVLVPFAPVDVYCSILATAAVILRRSDFKTAARGFDDKTRWLLGDDGAAIYEKLHEQGNIGRRRQFPEGGYFILGKSFGQPDECLIVADAGPLGYLSIAAHGHSDALSFTLSYRGRELLIDPGTYTYSASETWRNYFRGTSAHNTIRVDGVEQSVSGGDFLWTRHAHAHVHKIESTSDFDLLSMSHDGYMRLSDPVLHQRTLRFDKNTCKVTITDHLKCSGRHRIEVFWHFGEHCQVECQRDVIVCHCADVALSLRMSIPNWRPMIMFGQENPPLGWVSRRFDEKCPTNTAVWLGDIEGSSSLTTSMQCSTRPSLFELALQ